MAYPSQVRIRFFTYDCPGGKMFAAAFEELVWEVWLIALNRKATSQECSHPTKKIIYPFERKKGSVREFSGFSRSKEKNYLFEFFIRLFFSPLKVNQTFSLPHVTQLKSKPNGCERTSSSSSLIVGNLVPKKKVLVTHM